MIIDAEFTVKIKMENLVFQNNISGFELKSKLIQEGERRIKFLAAGSLIDPEGKTITQDVTYKIKED